MSTNFDSLKALVPQVDADIAEQERKIESLLLEVHDQGETILELKNELGQSQDSGFLNVWPSLHKRGDWIQAGNKGDSLGGSDRQNGTFIMTPGTIAKWEAKPNYGYNNGFWYIKDSGAPTTKRLLKTVDIMFTTQADIDNCNVIEFQNQQNFEDHVYNMAWQIPINHAGPYRTFTFKNPPPGHWDPTNIPAVKFVPGVWHQFVAEFFLDLKNRIVTHGTLTVDKLVYSVRINRPAEPMTQADYLSTGFQLGTKDWVKKPTSASSGDGIPPPPFTVYTKNMNDIF